jgi:2-polyprenyl-6-methoxyphenol hydroxylase-like FAD-dependent oxidoreductase
MGHDVQFGKIFERYEQLEDGRIGAHFADGTSATGNILVGVDGTNSAVRKLVVPGAKILNVGRRIYGKTPITAGPYFAQIENPRSDLCPP